MRDSHYPASGNPIVFFDLETTGLSAKTDSIIEIAAVKYIPGANSHPHMQHLIRTDRPLPPFITKLTGISDEMLRADGRHMEEVLDEFIEFVGDHDVVAYNVGFDSRFINAAIERHGRRPLANARHCALARARAAWPNLENHKLAHLAMHLDLDGGQAHRALNDTLLALEVYFLSFQGHRLHESGERVGKTTASALPAIPVITGPRQYRVEVLGTRRYQPIFEALCGPRTAKGAALDIQVQLRLESSSNAVKVLVQEDVIGNLAPRVAQDFRRAIVDGDLTAYKYFECTAKIRGGRISALPADGDYVIWLDIPQDDD
jgi:DNA polymerase-3 subunit epsilon